MHRLFIDEKSSFALDKWRIYNPGFVIAAPMYFQKFEVIFPPECGRSFSYRAIVEKKKDYIKISLKKDKELIIVTKVIPDDIEKEHDFKILISVKNEQVKQAGEQVVGELMKEFASDILTANAFLTYGNVFEEKFLKLNSRNDGQDKVIVFRELNGEVYAAEARSHKSPEGVFSVRGHFRRYQSGKVIWIDEYLKGVEKEKQKESRKR